MNAVWTCAAPAATARLGAALGAVLQPGDVVGLGGALGAGKTQFVRGVAAGADAPATEVASPTFALVHLYAGRLEIAHADFYRLTSEDDLYGTGFFDLLPEGSAAVLVEWWDRFPRALPEDALRLAFETVGRQARRISATSSGPRSDARLAAFVQEARNADIPPDAPRSAGTVASK